MKPFTESLIRQPDFDTYYAEEIEPELARLESHRKTRMRLVLTLAALGAVGLGTVAALALAGQSESFSALVAFTLGFGCLVGAGLAYRGLCDRYKKVLVGKVCTFLGLDYTLGSFDFPLRRFTSLLPFYKSAKLEDRISGHVNGVDFELCEGKFSKKESKWRALMLIFSFEKAFEGETSVVADTSWIGNAIESLRQKGQRVALESLEFEGRFEVYSTDQLEARYLLTPRFMERIMDLTERFNNKKGVALAFSDSQLLVAIRIGANARRFEIGNVFHEVRDGAERARSLVAEIECITDIIEILNLSESSHA
ncbi:DUF3137 domain-containing protein [Nitratireductor sp. GISD-1A_MAKvit]|uniref:DUF3137 domain-containing protein n=1 Tax=Nitratireductor sp. GISD-1A_MAKvit TaxID=3234198 RepID=UPI003467CF54